MGQRRCYLLEIGRLPLPFAPLHSIAAQSNRAHQTIGANSTAHEGPFCESGVVARPRAEGPVPCRAQAAGLGHRRRHVMRAKGPTFANVRSAVLHPSHVRAACCRAYTDGRSVDPHLSFAPPTQPDGLGSTNTRGFAPPLSLHCRRIAPRFELRVRSRSDRATITTKAVGLGGLIAPPAPAVPKVSGIRRSPWRTRTANWPDVPRTAFPTSGSSSAITATTHQHYLVP